MAITSVIATVERSRPFRLDRAHAQTAGIGEFSQIVGRRAMVVIPSRSLVLPPLHVQIGNRTYPTGLKIPDTDLLVAVSVPFLFSTSNTVEAEDETTTPAPSQ
jgi:hypothetical protein